MIWRYLKAPDHRKAPVAASPSSLSVVTDVVQAADELGAESSAADSVGLLNASQNYWVVLFSLIIPGFRSRSC